VSPETRPLLHEIVVAMHIHTRFSDGSGTHAEVAKAAARAGVDAIIVTDHNVRPKGIEGYHRVEGKNVLVLVGEEVHDRTRKPQKNHLLALGAPTTLSPYAEDMQVVINKVNSFGGVSFLAHPVDFASPLVGEPDISWEDWQVHSFTGIELWNGLSEFKGHLKNYLNTVFYSLFFHQVAVAPYKETLALWDEMLKEGKRVVAVGGADAHALRKRLGPLTITLFPYEKHFRAITTHLLLKTPLNGKAEHDRALIYNALREGRAFIGYDLPASTRGFRFTATNGQNKVSMGETIQLNGGVTLKVRLPKRAECRLIYQGEAVRVWKRRDVCSYNAKAAGAYRVEAYLNAWGRRRGWIFSNPIYVTP